MAELGFIGLGIMGLPMAGHLRAGGHRVHVYARRRSASELSALGFLPCSSPRQVAERGETTILMLPNTPDVESVLFASQGVAEGLSAGKTVIDMSSISPIATREFAARLAKHGADYLDAPVSGGEGGAKAATLTIMVGGKSEAFERSRPLFALMGKTITLVGDVGAGQTAKVANQIIVALTIEAVAEALLFAARAGVDPAKVRTALLGGYASSRILEVHGERMIRRNFEPGFRLELHQKDIGLALEGARALQLSLPHTASCAQMMNAASALGWSELDSSVIVEVLEKLAGHRVDGAGARSAHAA
jgi:2-hydroxy-3-oxopropionate reductase